MKKLLAIFLLFAVLFSVVSCADPNEGETSDNIEKDQPTELEIYDGIIKKYTGLLIAKANGEEITVPDDGADEIDVALHEIVRDSAYAKIIVGNSIQQADHVMGYATKDINKDGIDELVLLDDSNKLFALFTIKDASPVLLLNMNLMSAAITSDGTVYAYAGRKYREIYGVDKDFTYVKKIVDGKLEGLEYGTQYEDGVAVSMYIIENGKRTKISSTVRDSLHNMYPALFRSQLYTKRAGFRFVPAIADDSDETTAPTPDFTSYDGILAAYKIIVESYSEYSDTDWMIGKFDSLFKITDNDTYDVFHQIYYGGIKVKPTETRFGQEYAKDGDNAYGYAKKDLSGDGIDELIFLNDNYEIFAIFTMKDGCAVLLDDMFGVWIDGDGYIRKHNITGGDVSRDSEVFVYKLKGSELSTLIALGYKVSWTLEKGDWYRIDGNTKTVLPFEDGRKLYAEYDIPKHGCDENEYTKAFSGIEFIPLFEAAAPSEKFISPDVNTEEIFGDTIYLTAISDSEVTFEFNKVNYDYDSSTNVETKEVVTVTGDALRDGNKYVFDIDGFKGYIEFAVNSVWIVFSESPNELVPCAAYLFGTPEP